MSKLEPIYKAVDQMTQPPMPPGEVLELLEQLASNIEGRIEGIKDDMRRTGQDWG